DHIHYSGEPECLGNISAFDSRFYRKFKQIAAECSRVLKKNKFLTLYICDFFKKKKGFSPTGFKLFKIFSKYFKPIDIIAVTRHNNDLQKNNFRKAAVENNFFLRGFNYLFIFKKPRNRKKYCLNNF
ncbi:MAG TPA: DNA methylase, partial [Spirochaetota bacterium]|nr:DNA methylase [Spirochaetota bacterium]